MCSHRRLILCLSITMLAFAFPVSAKTLHMLFWYPGEAGTSQEAQPVLQLFFTYINERLSPDRLTGIYLNNVQEGRNYLQQQKPVLVIVSTPLFLSEKNRLQGKAWLATLPLPAGKDSETYTLVGLKPMTCQQCTLYSNPTMDKDFILHHLFPRLPPFHHIPTSQVLSKLRSIGMGNEDAYLILSPLEQENLRHLKGTWTQSLRILASSPAIPSARVLLMGKEDKTLQKLKEILVQMSSDTTAEPILVELRLKGFSPLPP